MQQEIKQLELKIPDLTSENERGVRKIKRNKRFLSDSESEPNMVTCNTSLKSKSVITEKSEESDFENETVSIPILRKATKGN